jgi:phosphoribosylaminoimidazole carboxylase
MLNIIGATSGFDELTILKNAALAMPGASVHLYGKADNRKGRKMGHITLVADSDAQLRNNLRPLLEALPSGDSAAEISKYAPTQPSPGSGHSNLHPLVGVIMGSDSDLPVMLPAARMLDRFNIPYELTIVSAHRTPDRLVEYARSASSRGLRTIIAGAGGAAHLPGMVAAMTALPVIGVPVKGSSLDGVDSLHSIVQMPASDVYLPCEFADELTAVFLFSFSGASLLPLLPSVAAPTLVCWLSVFSELACPICLRLWIIISKVWKQRYCKKFIISNR